MSAESSAGPRAGSGDSGLTGNLSGNSAGSRAPTSCSTGGEEESHVLKNRTNMIAPPLIPVHRYPSWEGRIYQIANDANGILNNETTSANALLYGETLDPVSAGDSVNNNNQPVSSESRNNFEDQIMEYERSTDANNRLSTASLRGSIGFGSDVSVPVYASIKGVSNHIKCHSFNLAGVSILLIFNAVY